MEDLDRVTSSPEHERRQLDDLARLGLDHDGAVVRQSERFDLYEAALDRLNQLGVTYPCWCTRREIREAASAPHDGVLRYPGTCRHLDRRRLEERWASGRRPALRLDAAAASVGLHRRRRRRDWTGEPFDDDSTVHVSIYATEP